MSTALCSSGKAIGLKEEPGNYIAQLHQNISYQHLVSAFLKHRLADHNMSAVFAMAECLYISVWTVVLPSDI